MADPLSISLGIPILTVFAFQSSGALCQTVASLQNNQRTVRQLKEEPEVLSGALEAPQETITNVDTDLMVLRLPLLRILKR
ncbi:hypothetical protein BKA64DRAFT_57897 [Cadophora sp. MPI-SDFR-AT-0126]|nr:hypothetical protein BKA64DRAFT_57897 [Leotiomycetes sp. MPI-SDFR-AT-0126]